MARHLRLEFEGAIYHVTSRGNERSEIFGEDKDKEQFLEKLAENVEQHHVRLYAYVIMSNHYHLLIETPRGNISKFMQQLNTSYTMYYNVRHDRVGHAFSGRYKAKVVSGDEYLLALTRYIHLNPVKIAAMRGRTLREKIERLRKFRWSSYAGYTELWRKESWVDYGPLEELAGKYRAEKKESYRVFVESGLAEDDEDLKEALDRSSKAVGGWKFCRWIERKYKETGKDAGRKSDVAMRRVEAGTETEVMEKLVSKVFGVDSESLKRRRSKEDARLVVAKLMKEYSGLTQREIGMRLGLADGSGLGHLLRIADKRLDRSWKLRRMYAKLEATL